MANPKQPAFERPILTVDVVCFTLINGGLHVLLMQRENAPFKGRLVLPGGYVHINEDADTLAAARRIAKDKLDINVSYMEQLGTFSGKDRDPRGWSASVAYVAVIPSSLVEPQEFYPITTGEVYFGLPELGFDHNKIIEKAVERIRNKTSYSSLPLFLMPAWFTLGELQRVYEAMLGIPKMTNAYVQRFRRRVIDQGIIESTGRWQDANKVDLAGRPAELFRVTDQALKLFEQEIV